MHKKRERHYRPFPFLHLCNSLIPYQFVKYGSQVSFQVASPPVTSAPVRTSSGSPDTVIMSATSNIRTVKSGFIYVFMLASSFLSR